MAKSTCAGCQDGVAFPMPFTMAFQPIVDLAGQRVFAHEALVRGVDGAGAGAVLGAVTSENRYGFDQACRVKAIELAAGLAMPASGARLSINFLPNAVYEASACIRLTMATARRTGFPPERLIFEFTEDERVDAAHLIGIIATYKAMGFMTAIDDFGAGYAGLTLLAQFQPDLVKLDMALIRGLDTSRVKQTVVRGIAHICRELGVAVLAEGIETVAESETARDLGITLQQGYLFARPAFEALADPTHLAAPALAVA